MCGTGDQVDILQPTKIIAFEGQKVKVIGCGAGHSLALLENS
jgi:hypothetical protein